MSKLERLRYNEAEDVPHFRKWGCSILEQAVSIYPQGTRLPPRCDAKLVL